MGKLSRTLVRSFCPTLGYAITDILTKVTNFIIRLQTLWFLCSLLFPYVEVCEETSVLREKPQDFFLCGESLTSRFITSNSDPLKSETSSVSCIALEFDARRGLGFNLLCIMYLVTSCKSIPQQEEVGRGTAPSASALLLLQDDRWKCITKCYKIREEGGTKPTHTSAKESRPPPSMQYSSGVVVLLQVGAYRHLVSLV